MAIQLQSEHGKKRTHANSPQMGGTHIYVLQCETMNDQIKMDHIIEVINGYSPEEIEKALPRRY